MGNTQVVIETQTQSQTKPQQQPQQQKQEQPKRKIFKQAKRPDETQQQQTNQEFKQSASMPEQQKKNQIQKSLALKNQGNQYILQKQFAKALQCYNEAIALHNQDSIYYSNRAVTFRLLGKLDQAKLDAKQAIKMDSENVRAWFLLGTINLIEVQQEYNEKNLNEQLLQKGMDSVQTLISAFNKIKHNTEEQKQKLKAQINQNLGKGRRIVFLIAIIMDKQNAKNLKNLLNTISLRQKQKLDQNTIDHALSKNTTQDIQVPEYYQCVITQEIMKEPFLFNSGQTYEKESIIQAFKTSGFIDPKTRVPIEPKYAIHNKQLNQAITELTSKYGWLGIEDSDDIKQIKLE